MRAALVLAVSAVALAGCGGSAPPPAPPPVEAARAETTRLARYALDQGQAATAARLYDEALASAQRRDDLASLADLATDAAIAHLRAYAPGKAFAIAHSARLDLARQGLAVPPKLPLVELVAAYRAGNVAGRVEAERALAAYASLPPDVAERAGFIRGMVAADSGDRAGVLAALQAMPPLEGNGAAGDRAELNARAALLGGDQASALAAADAALVARRAGDDEPGIVRALALSGAAEAMSGRWAKAADAHLRAGRAALLAGDTPTARVQLAEADRLARRSADAALIAEVASWRDRLPPPDAAP